jgi:hypothetical protein
MNFNTGRDVFIASALFAVLPQETVSPLAVSGLLCTALYFLNGKLPKQEL